MGKIISSYMVPHPPIIIPEVGKGGEAEAAKTIEAVKRAAADIGKARPATIIITTPHGPVFEDYIHISSSETLEGTMSRFGAKDVKLRFKNNPDLVDRIVEAAREKDIPCGGIDDTISGKYRISKELDHGATVPLYFINREYSDFKLVHISIAAMPFEQLYVFGTCIQKAIEESDEEVVFVASGDLSHRLSEDAPYGYSAKGREFDALLLDSVEKMDISTLIRMDEGFCDQAGECGLRSFLMMFGALDGYELRPEVYSYEGPFGVGYSVVRFFIGDRKVERSLLTGIKEENGKKEDPYVNLARNTLETYVKEGRVVEVPKDLPKEMLENRAGTFVSIKKLGQLRGCIGTIGPTRVSIAEEIMQNAISAGTEDPRFSPVRPEELEHLVYSVDVLHASEPIESLEQLDVIRYGVIVRSGRRSGLLLPNLEGITTPEEQVSIALQKAGIRSGEKYEMERFEVVRHK